MRPLPEQLSEMYRQMDPSVYESELQGRNRTAKSHLRIVQRYLQPGRVLDVGCASGLFLIHAMQADWNVTGMSPMKPCANRLAGA
jgi:2-polyprenyl-3-methyl-5-hydroxy-6-metoxy-1,4-benzoquinol methylase